MDNVNQGRVIKFRAWDASRKTFYTPNSISGSNGEAEDVVSQFTGLFDINGKEIYEGDIIEYKQYLFNVSEEHFPIKQKAVAWNNLRGGWNVYETKAGEDNIKVIGHIYDLPELNEDQLKG